MYKTAILIFFTISIAFNADLAHAGKWRTGEGATIEDALRNAIDRLDGTKNIKSIDRRSKSFKTICKETGVLYRVRMHGNYYGEGGGPDEEWIEREAQRLSQYAKVCPITKECRNSLRENIAAWHAGTSAAPAALTSIETDCKVPRESSLTEGT